MTRPVALVTGAARGIGRAIARDLCADHDVAITFRATDPPDGHHAIRADFADPGVACRVVDAVMDRFGRLDVIVNNAGVIPSAPMHTFDLREARETLDVNLLAPYALLDAALPHLRPGAALVGISSVNAVSPPEGAAMYAASKAALSAWTRAMAKEHGPKGIRVNAVAPGLIEIPEAPRDPDTIAEVTGQTALRRTGTPEDVARVVRFLAGPQSGFVTGEVLTVSGGYRL